MRGTNEPTFRGFYNSNWAKKLLLTTTEALPNSLSSFTFKQLEKLSEKHPNATKQLKTYERIVSDFIQAVTDESDPSFRKKLKLSEDWVKNISKDNLPNLPQKGQVTKFIETLADPFVSLFNLYKPIARSKFGKKFFPTLHNKLLKEKNHELLIEQYKGFLGLNNSIKKWENSYRQFSGNSYWSADSEFIIPQDVLTKKLQGRLSKAFNPNLGKYSTKSLLMGNRLISGIVYSVYLSTDAFNTTMKFSGNKDESQKQQKSRFIQENARIGLNLFLQNVIFRTFEPQMNKSLTNALLASGATVALSEIAGRKLVSKPIMPADKKTLDGMEQEMYAKKGILPSLGRLMTRVKKVDKPKVSSTSVNPFAPSSPLPKQFGAFTASKNSVSFTGKVPQMFNSEHLSKLLKIIEDYDPIQYGYYKKIIENGFEKIKIGEKDLSGMSLEDAIKDLTSVPIGEMQTMSDKVMHSVFAPVDWIKNGYKSAVKTFKKFAPKNKQNELSDFIKENKLENEYQEFLTMRLSQPAWQQSGIKDNVAKEAKIKQEFVENKKHIKDEIQWVKDVILWLDKQIKTNKFNLDDLSDKQRADLEKMIEEAMVKMDGAKQIKYDGNSLAQLNIHIARIITTIFLVTDAYNLTMQYSNDNKKDAKTSAKNRAIQEITRISVSAYMLGFIHNLLSKVCNSSLLGAFGVTLLTSITNDTLARLFVGVPLTPQSQDKLLKK